VQISCLEGPGSNNVAQFDVTLDAHVRDSVVNESDKGAALDLREIHGDQHFGVGAAPPLSYLARLHRRLKDQFAGHIILARDDQPTVFKSSPCGHQSVSFFVDREGGFEFKARNKKLARASGP